MICSLDLNRCILGKSSVKTYIEQSITILKLLSAIPGAGIQPYLSFSSTMPSSPLLSNHDSDDIEEDNGNMQNTTEALDVVPGIELQSRCLPLPPTSVSRFPGRNGSVGTGSQRSTREVYNRMYAQFVGNEYNEDYPISRQMVIECAEICRTYLYNERGIMPGKYTWKQLRGSQSQALYELRRTLERTFKELTLAKGYWAANHLVKSVLRRDKRRFPSSTEEGVFRGSEPRTIENGDIEAASIPGASNRNMQVQSRGHTITRQEHIETSSLANRLTSPVNSPVGFPQRCTNRSANPATRHTNVVLFEPQASDLSAARRGAGVNNHTRNGGSNNIRRGRGRVKVRGGLSRDGVYRQNRQVRKVTGRP